MFFAPPGSPADRDTDETRIPVRPWDCNRHLVPTPAPADCGEAPALWASGSRQALGGQDVRTSTFFRAALKKKRLTRLERGRKSAPASKFFLDRGQQVRSIAQNAAAGERAPTRPSSGGRWTCVRQARSVDTHAVLTGRFVGSQMIGRSQRSPFSLAPLSQRPRCAFLAACWLSAAVYCAALCWNDDRFAGAPDGARFDTFDLTVGRNETGRFSLRRLDAKAGYQPAFYVAWENLEGANGQLGLFNTALHKTIIIDGLEARFYRYPDDEADGKNTAAGPAGPPRHGGSFLSPAAYGAPRSPESDARRDDATGAYPTSPVRMLHALEYELRGDLEGIEVENSLLIDVSNATKLVIRDLDYAFFEGETLTLGVRCSRATVSKSGSERILSRSSTRRYRSGMLWSGLASTASTVS